MLEYAALIGIDWADAKHDGCLLDCASGKREPTVIKHTPEELDRWADSLRRRYPGQKVAVCEGKGSVEDLFVTQPHGDIISAATVGFLASTARRISPT